MSLRKSKFLIRSILILICFQFTAATFVSGEIATSSSHASFAAHKATKPISLSSLFEKSETEGEEKNKDFDDEVQDIRSFDFNRIISVQTHLGTDVISLHIRKPSLHGLHCVFLI
jgi:hypothetical protein